VTKVVVENYQEISLHGGNELFMRTGKKYEKLTRIKSELWC